MSTSRRSRASRKQIVEIKARVTAGGRYKSMDEARLARGNPQDFTWAGSFRPTDEELAEFIVCYFNGTDVEDTKLDLVKTFPSLGRGLLGLVKAIFFTYMTGLPKSIEDGQAEGLANPSDPTVPPVSPQELRNAERAVRDLQEERDQFRDAVIWLCTPRQLPEISVDPVEHSDSDLLNPFLALRADVLGILLSPPRTAEDEKYLRYFEQHGITHIKKDLTWALDRLAIRSTPLHLIDLFCSFLIEGALQGQDDMPVKMCSNCQSLFSCTKLKGRARLKKKYCSTKCQNAGYWVVDRRTDYRYVERFDDYSDPDLRKRLTEPKVQQRLQEIEERWSKWPGILDRIKVLRKKAGSVSSPSKRK